MNNKFKSIFQIARKEVEDYCINLPMTEIIDDQAFIDRNPYIYLVYPYLFSDVFCYTDKSVLSKLAIAGFLLYRSIIIKDAYLDGNDHDFKSKEGKNYILAKDICQEEALRLLFKLFGSESEFWQFWNLRRNEYLKAEEMNRQLSLSQFDRQLYEQFADYKSTFGKLAIDALHVLSNQKFLKEYELLNRSHAMFSVGLQIYDDTKDMEEDYGNQQYNWAYSNLPKYHKNANIQTLKKFFFVSGTAQKAYRESISYFEQAEITARGCDCPHWLDEIAYRKQLVRAEMRVLGEYLAELVEND